MCPSSQWKWVCGYSDSSLNETNGKLQKHKDGFGENLLQRISVAGLRRHKSG